MNQKRLETGAFVFGHLVYDKDTLEGQCRKNDLFKRQCLQFGISVENIGSRPSYKPYHTQSIPYVFFPIET